MKIELKKVRVHNLKEVSLNLNHGELIVFTGVSGSGKSSLAFDTIYVEGQLRYIESLSTYARRYLGALPKPDAELISGISPTIAIEQKSIGRTPRSTVGTMTGIYDFLRILYSRAGTAYCPISGQKVTPQSRSEILSTLSSYPPNTKMIFLSPFAKGKKGEFKEEFKELSRKGFIRLRVDGELIELSDSMLLDKKKSHDVDLVIDRLTNEDEKRVLEAMNTALEWGKGLMSVLIDKEELLFSELAYSSESGLSYPPLEPQDFSFNHPQGMCATCEGIGRTQVFNLAEIIDPELSIKENCCSLAGTYETVKWGNIYNNLASLYKFSVKTPWKKLSPQAQNIFLYGNKKKWTQMAFVHPETGKTWTEYVKWQGVLHEAKERYLQATSTSYKERMEELMEESLCPDCKGSRLKPYPSATQIHGKTIQEITSLSIEKAHLFFESMPPTPFQMVVDEILKRFKFLLNVGLNYLSLDRISPTLSGGEAQRVRLASQIGSGLVGTTYILDEPSIGLHPQDNHKLIHTLKMLRDLGNTVIVVEHDAETILSADTVVDVGPGAGINGGHILYQGSPQGLLSHPTSLTGAYLSGRKQIKIPLKRNIQKRGRLTLKGAFHHNLKNITLDLPLGAFTAITGVSGSGKSSLITDTLYPALLGTKGGKYEKLLNREYIDKVILIDQSPIGRTPRSNPSTYIKLFDEIRDLFSELPESKMHGFKPGRFSFNVREGCCPLCQGMGLVEIDMDFMDSAYVKCEECQGKRFDALTLSVKYKGYSISDVLNMSVNEASLCFDAIPQIFNKLHLLQTVGLGYLTLGQSSTTLSGGEAQRIKLSRELIRKGTGSTLYILDEPTTGLHFADIDKLLHLLHSLVDQGNTVVVIEHNQDLIKTADWTIELGPEGGQGGGYIIYEGPPKLENVSPENSPPPSHKAIQSITISHCHQNTLKNISLSIPRGKITILTGPSGSGKSSLAFETIYAEGQRRYIESLSSYARQFVSLMPKPSLDSIEGLSPAIAIEQKHHAGNPRSTVGTITEIYDFLRLLYTHMGTAHCPETGEKIESITQEYAIAQLMELPEKTKLHILAPIKGGFDKEALQKEGFLRIRLNGDYFELDENIPYDPRKKNALYVVIDRLIIKPGIEHRLSEAIEKGGNPFIAATEEKDLFFNLSFAVRSTGKTYPPLTPHSFSFNKEEGMCPVCQGLGTLFGADFSNTPEILKLSPLQLLDKLSKETYTDKGEQVFLDACQALNIDPDLSLKKQPNITSFMQGRVSFESHGMTLTWLGINETFLRAAKGIQRSSLIPHLTPVPCYECHGEKLSPLARHVLIKGVSLPALCHMPIKKGAAFLSALTPPPFLQDTFLELQKRLEFLIDIGVDYLSLDRTAPTLSGGETQRIHLARQLGSGLTGCLYILDEPTIGLHPHNTGRLNKALQKMAANDNTLIIVEHEAETLEIADHIIDFGPEAGVHGGRIMAEGTLAEIMNNPNSLTGAYLSGKKTLPLREKRRIPKEWISIANASMHNLKNISVQIPRALFTCITGVSGSGKSTLVHNALPTESFERVIRLDQNPIGTTSRADICTYSDILSLLRPFFASLPEAKIRGLSPAHFSYNHLKGMCRTCWGLGHKTFKLQLLPPVITPCPSCSGLRLNPLSLEVKYQHRSLGELLSLTIFEALEFLPPIPKLTAALNTLVSVGLGYLTLGQEIASLSGGEAGRLRLSRELAKRTVKNTLYIFDEPTIGLHFEDIKKLLPIFHALVDKGNTLIVIEHNLDLIMQADYVIDLGPDAGDEGGEIMAVGTPEEIAASPHSKTGYYLAKKKGLL
ncbi:MAG: excinuclease ABC subunit UvrA [Simkaniaceae bacterium]|nr:excinuclease ABC subunit UvrA [Simkaniaceae bacterium]